MAVFSTDAILLKRVEYGDHDLIITYFTRSFGRLSVIAKNAKKSVKRFQGSLDPFSAMNIQCTPQKRKNALPVLSSVDLEDPFARIRMDVGKTGYASYWLELVHSWMEDGKTQGELFDLLVFVLDGLNRDVMEKENLSLLFQIRFLAMAGFTPDFISCGQCNVPLDQIAQPVILFDLVEGRLVCDRCATRAVRYGIRVSKGTLKQLSWINSRDMSQAARIKWTPRAVKEAENLLESFIPCHLGKTMKSLTFLRRIRG